MTMQTYSTIATLVPINTRLDQMQWVGFNDIGTLAYGIRYYNARENVKVYRASIYGSIHELADVEFAKTYWLNAMFYIKRKEFVWLHQIAPVFCEYTPLPVYSLIMFNVDSGQLKRYYGHCYDMDGFIDDCIFMSTVDDVMILMDKIPIGAIRLYEIELNQTGETFSVKILAVVQRPADLQVEWKYLVYYRDHLVYVCPDFQTVLVYEFNSGHWSEKSVLCVYEIPNESDELTPMINGKIFFFQVVGEKIRLLKFDEDSLMWTESCSVNLLYLHNGNRDQWLAFSDCQTLCQFWQKQTTMTKFISVGIKIYCWKEFRLKDLCLRALWQWIPQLFPQVEHLTDHDLCDRFRLSSVFNMDECFGRKYTRTL